MSEKMSEGSFEMLLKDYAESRQKKTDTLRKFISRHEEFTGHTKHGKKGLEIDEEAVKLLDESFPPPVEIVAAPDAELQKKVMQLQEVIIKLQAQQADLQAKAALADARSLLLEDREQRIQELKTEKETAEHRAAELDAELERIRNRNLWQRIFDK